MTQETATRFLWSTTVCSLLVSVFCIGRLVSFEDQLKRLPPTWLTDQVNKNTDVLDTVRTEQMSRTKNVATVSEIVLQLESLKDRVTQLEAK